MNTSFKYKVLAITASAFFIISQAFGQITSPSASATIQTAYSGTGKQDQIFIFCSTKGVSKASLTVSTSLTGSINYEWQKFDSSSMSFAFYSSQANGGAKQTISNLTDGAYRVSITNGTDTETYTAWVFNNYYIVTAAITESNCSFFQITASSENPTFTYFDLTNGQAKGINKNIDVAWKANGEKVSAILSPKIFDPPTKDTNYTLTVSDRFGCSATADVSYRSIVTKAKFDISADFTTGQSGEAPLEVKFTNSSENGTSGKYEWFFYKDVEVIKDEIEKSKDGKIDSIDFVAYNDELSYTFERSGKYMVKLVSKKISESHTCTDTLYLDDYIVADTSFVKAPNFFTPNGDGTNDKFVIKFWSVKSIKISIFDRWGKKVHAWDSSNVRGFINTTESIKESVWDGRIGGQIATPGVYYYVVEAQGRDGRHRWAHGFFHLFRGKD